MSDTAKRFRDRARDCLNLAKGARHRVDRIMLEEIADDLSAEADKIEAQAAMREREGHSTGRHS